MGLPTEDLPPPTYTEATSASSPSLSRFTSSALSQDTTGTSHKVSSTSTGAFSPRLNSTSSGDGGGSSPLTTHLRTLPARLRASHLARQTAQAALELDLIALLVPHVEAFLARDDIISRLGSSSYHSSSFAELTLVPSSAVPPAAGMSGAAEREREGEIVRAGRVAVARGLRILKGFGDEKGGFLDDDDGLDGRRRNRNWSGAESSLRQAIKTDFEEWGRFDSFENDGGGRLDAALAEEEGEWWFKDEEMARRLAAYLRPEPNLERKHVQGSVVENRAVEKERSGWGRWGLGGSSRKKAAERASPGLPSPVSPALSSPGSAGEDDAIKMTVRAEEVTFRWENDFGLWESKTGWGIVVTLRVKP
ncbi:hypothetical protein P885DRAFT_45890 [Corynascus similis CBS 632.67]